MSVCLGEHPNDCETAQLVFIATMNALMEVVQSVVKKGTAKALCLAVYMCVSLCVCVTVCVCVCHRVEQCLWQVCIQVRSEVTTLS